MGPTDRLPGLHALRCLAAMLVFILHVVFLSTDYVQSVYDFVTPWFALGVQLFYVVSAFALMHSTRLYSDRRDWVRSFYLKRFFRIAPLWYLVVAWTVVHRYYAEGQVIGPTEILLNATFVNNLIPYYSLSIVYAGWSIGVEMLFYLIFPLVFLFVRSLWTGLAFVLVSVLIGEIAMRVFENTPTQLFPYAAFSFPANLRYFAFGVMAFLLWDRLLRTRWALPDLGAGRALAFHLVCASLVAALSAFILINDIALRALYRIDMVLWGLVFMVLTVWFSTRPFAFLSWMPIQYLGERSYSLYLWHVLLVFYMAVPARWLFDALAPVMGDWALAPAILITWLPVVAVASLSYRLVERPGMALGKWVDARVRGNVPARQPA